MFWWRKNQTRIYLSNEIRCNDYYVSLISAELNSLFPNIIKDKNDKFYYTDSSNNSHIIKFTEGTYEIEDLNAHLQLSIPNDTQSGKIPIKIILDKGSGRSKIFLKQGYSVDFTKNDTFRDILGFDSISICGASSIQSYVESTKMCDVVLSTKIYIHCNIVKGCIFNGQSSDILYSFPNDREFGHLINIKPYFKRKHLLVNKTFSEMNTYFTDQNNQPITFMKTPVTLTFEIRQV